MSWHASRHAELVQQIQHCKSAFDILKLQTQETQTSTPHVTHTIKVRGFLTAIHAAFEQFFEDVADRIVDDALAGWVGAKRSTPACALILHYTQGLSAIEELEPRFTDRGRTALTDCANRHKDLINKANHGISEQKHLRKLFFPLGIDLPEDIKQVSAIEQLVRIRGDAAHRYTAKTPPKPIKYWLGIIDDCASFALEIAKAADRITW